MRRIFAGLLLLTLTTACGTVNAAAAPPSATIAHSEAPTSPASPAETASPAVSTACVPGMVTGPIGLPVLRQVAYDYQPYDTVEALAGAVDGVVVAGEVVEFLPGRVVEEGIPGDRTHYVLMRVRVTERFKGAAPEYVHAELFQGGITGPGRPVHSVRDFNRAVPKGTRVMLFMNDATSLTEHEKPIEDRAGLPPGTPIYRAFPQGIILEQVTESGRTLLGGLDDLPIAWNDPCGLDGLSARLRTAGFHA